MHPIFKEMREKYDETKSDISLPKYKDISPKFPNMHKAGTWDLIQHDGQHYVIDKARCTDQGLQLINKYGNWVNEFTEDKLSGTRVITPSGLQFLVLLYDKGYVERTQADKGRNLPFTKEQKCDALNTYVKLFNQAYRTAKAQMAERERRKALLENPETITERDFHIPGLISDVFWNIVGPFQGEKTIEIGGLQVTKVVGGMHFSNSGKNYDREVEISYLNKEGEKCLISTSFNRFENNRRNTWAERHENV
ncbi:hypothetical protein [Neptuniibacter sp. QD37_11]|uniref:hypothetical protein n=1 Tax=Neptuniibacter sp. QD37_11 TaxID=3398209 RepID=UPI0039F5EA37